MTIEFKEKENTKILKNIEFNIGRFSHSEKFKHFELLPSVTFYIDRQMGEGFVVEKNCVAWL